jgi:hypothetical protein
VVAIILGTIILSEPLTIGLLIGFPLVILGCWLAATGGTLKVRDPERDPESEAEPAPPRESTAELPPVAPG